jgi:hypothetical protein
MHAKPSVEARLVTSEDADRVGIRPLLFVDGYLKGEVLVDVYEAQDQAAGVGGSLAFTKNEMAFEILGRRNSLGKPAVCVARQVPPGDPTPGAAAVFCLLEFWSLSDRLLHLDLPRQYFAKPGKLHLWFLRGDTVLWKEVVDWPGY